MQPTLHSTARILYLGGNPSTDPKHQLAFDKEVEAIQQALKAHSPGDLPLAHALDIDIDDFFAALDRYPNAQVLHLAGHANAARGLFMKRGDGSSTEAPGLRLAHALVRHRNIRVVILSACSTASHAEPIKELVDCVVATSTKIGDKATVSFATGFYTELAKGQDIDAAYKHALSYVGVSYTQGDHSQADAYGIFHRDVIDPRWITIDRSPIPPETAIQRHDDTRIRLAERSPVPELVLHANEDAWETALPDRRGAQPEAVKFDPGAYATRDAWQHRYPLSIKPWQAGLAAVLSAADEARDAMRAGARVHLVARMPLSYFAIFGNRLELHGAAPVFCAQARLPGRSEPVWQAWGPGLEASRPTPLRAPVFRGVDLEETPRTRIRHVAVAIAITQPISKQDSKAVLEAACPDRSARILHLITPTAGPSQQRISDETVDQASAELEAFFNGLAGTYPNVEGVHVMYVGPGALLARAMCKAHLGRGDVFLYEYFRGHGYARVANVSKATLAIRPGDIAQG